MSATKASVQNASNSEPESHVLKTSTKTETSQFGPYPFDSFKANSETDTLAQQDSTSYEHPVTRQRSSAVATPSPQLGGRRRSCSWAKRRH